jgi:hypothetical protein
MNTPSQNFRNAMGVDKPIPFDQTEHDKTMAATLKKSQEVDAINAAAREKREAARTGVSKAQTEATLINKEHRRLQSEVRDATTRRYQYGEGDVNHWQTEVDKWSAEKTQSQTDGDEARAQRALANAQAELTEAKLRLHKYTAEHVRATGLLKSFESEHKIAPVKSAK